jgi:glycosyltransferase involved in cell wall biosynthesis
MENRKLKILHTVEFYDPCVGGMQEVVKRLSEGLAARGHDVTVATSFDPGRSQGVINGVKVLGFDVSGNRVRGSGFGDAEKYRKFLENSDFDVVVNFAAQQWATDLALPLLKKIKSKKVFVPTGFSGLYAPEYFSYFEELKKQIFDYDRCVFLSDDYRDILFAREVGYTNNQLIPNGASQAEFETESADDIRKKLGISKTSKIILNVGSHTGAKGHKEAIEILHESNIRDATLVIVGNAVDSGCSDDCRRGAAVFPIFGSVLFSHGLVAFIKSVLRIIKRRQFLKNFFHKKRVIVTSLSRRDTVHLFKEADVFLFPSKIECSPIVLFESMAGETPYLVTDVGNGKEILKWSQSGFILPTVHREGFSIARIPDSARLLEKLLGDSDLCASMAKRGKDAWLESFTWEKIVLKYERLYAEVVGE